ncbi:Transglutaminase-like superfamily protein [Micromonospora pattaloongensis]|uniref:Transglutaminase-like superfamily protein n=1 Tax=Micromonospora pattaloongensis TaxID=405436 RepID=A0A1H3R9W0_9ACTN|nr:transglutaminase domain-containing protein [Micromonospora pattaloongensis]SDZ22041.1 Transglutaminase-like superfamily protein [Micromonospora pattaloongensis]
MVRVLRAAPVPLALIAMIGLAGVVLGGIYADPLLTQLMLGAGAGSVAVSLAARRLPTWLVAPVSVVALAGYTLFALRLAASRAALPDPLPEVIADAARSGIPRLLTAMIPVEPLPDTVLVPVVAAWLAGLAGAELALRARRVLLGYAPPALLYVGAVYVVGPNAQTAVGPTLAFAALAVAGLAATGRPAGAAAVDGDVPAPVRAALRARVAAGAAAGVAAILALGAAIAPTVADRVTTEPVDPRRYVQPPQVDSLDESPLIRISGWALSPDQKLLDVATTGAAPSPAPSAGGGADAEPDGVGRGGVWIRLAVLNDYDGVTWRVGATYRNAGRVLPAAPRSPGATVEPVRQEITVAELTGRLLPAVATPEQVVGARVAYDPGSGTLIRPEGLNAGQRYTVKSAQERPDYNQLSAANVPAGDAVARVLRVADGAPEQLQRLAEQLATDNGSPYQRASAIEQFLAEHYRLVSDAPSGHAYPNLNFFLFGPRNAGGQRGTSEQFAAAFAVLGRLMGLPTRVVVGFHSPTGNGPVRGADAYAWPEVLFSDIGWVAFDPLPQPNTEPRPVEEDFKPKPEKSTPPPTEAPTPTAPATAPPSTSAAAAPPPRDRGPAGPLLAGIGAGTLVLLLAGGATGIVLQRRAQRRRRLDAGSPAARIAGAWLEVRDALRLAGHPAPAHLAATEVAAHARGVDARSGAAGADARSGPVRVAVPPIDDLATLVNLAAFAPGEADDEQARRAAAQAVAYADQVRERRPWWRRLLWSVHPGPLRWHR